METLFATDVGGKATLRQTAHKGLYIVEAAKLVGIQAISEAMDAEVEVAPDALQQ